MSAMGTLASLLDEGGNAAMDRVGRDPNRDKYTKLDLATILADTIVNVASPAHKVYCHFMAVPKEPKKKWAKVRFGDLYNGEVFYATKNRLYPFVKIDAMNACLQAFEDIDDLPIWAHANMYSFDNKVWVLKEEV